eukprot:TRINITY_DN670_c0_g1_i11.p1 TRINITY_DN670_c0_g1~~TRINITY_DN670_c0_g1_i11.p1  ORF type:complete len:301 (-),score=36.44 TRINITY_DN670_c0_g1_i11:393-1295(-)
MLLRRALRFSALPSTTTLFQTSRSPIKHLITTPTQARWIGRTSEDRLESFVEKTDQDFVDALALMSRGRMNEASQKLTSLLQREPHNPLYLINQAICICGIPSRANEAEQLANRGAIMTGEHPRALVHLAHVLREIGQADFAVKVLERVVNDLPEDDWEFHYEMGLSLINNWCRYSPAVWHLTKSLQVNPRNGLAWYWRGHALYWLEKEGAFDWLTEDNISGDPREDFFTGLLEYRRKNYSKALESFNAAEVGLRSNNISDIWSWRGECNLALGQLEQGKIVDLVPTPFPPSPQLLQHGW